MNKIIVLVGENISDLSFQCGGSSVQGLHVVQDQKPKWIHHIDSTYRKCPEDGKHPKVYQEELVEDIGYVLKHWNYIVSTNSEKTLDIIFQMIYEGTILTEQLVIYGLNELNSEIIFTSTLDKEDMCLHNWTYGFFDINVK